MCECVLLLKLSQDITNHFVKENRKKIQNWLRKVDQGEKSCFSIISLTSQSVMLWTEKSRKSDRVKTSCFFKNHVENSCLELVSWKNFENWLRNRCVRSKNVIYGFSHRVKSVSIWIWKIRIQMSPPQSRLWKCVSVC